MNAASPVATASPSPTSLVTSTDQTRRAFSARRENWAPAHRPGTRKIGVALDEDGTVRPVPYADKPGRPQIRALFAGLCESCGCEAVLEGGNTIALKRKDGAITLEPGGQFRAVGAAFVLIPSVPRISTSTCRRALPLAERLSIAFVGVGFRPLWHLGRCAVDAQRPLKVMRDICRRAASWASK